MEHNHDNHFANPAAIASYLENAQRNVPGLADLHRMVMLLLAEQAHGPAHILVVGAGGGMGCESPPDGRRMNQANCPQMPLFTSAGRAAARR